MIQAATWGGYFSGWKQPRRVRRQQRLEGKYHRARDPSQVPSGSLLYFGRFTI
jgi:hypothetical protein